MLYSSQTICLGLLKSISELVTSEVYVYLFKTLSTLSREGRGFNLNHRILIMSFKFKKKSKHFSQNLGNMLVCINLPPTYFLPQTPHIIHPPHAYPPLSNLRPCTYIKRAWITWAVRLTWPANHKCKSAKKKIRNQSIPCMLQSSRACTNHMHIA